MTTPNGPGYVHADDAPKPAPTNLPRVDPKRVAELHRVYVAAEQEHRAAQDRLTAVALEAIARSQDMHAARQEWETALGRYHRQQVDNPKPP